MLRLEIAKVPQAQFERSVNQNTRRFMKNLIFVMYKLREEQFNGLLFSDK